MNEVPRIMDDPRAITAVWFPGGEDGYRIGMDGVTRIVSYEEQGDMAMVTWFAVYMGEHLLARIPMRAVRSVLYAWPPDEGGDHE